MNNEKYVTYTFKWSQPYTEWKEWVDNKVEESVKVSDFKEANELIERIKKL